MAATPTPITRERRDGRKRAIRPTGTEGSRLGRVSAGRASSRTPRTSPLPAKLLQVGQVQVAEELDLVLEHEVELLVGTAPRLRHQREGVGRRRAAGVLDEVRVLRGDASPANRVAPEAARVEQPPRAQFVIR